MTAVGEIGLWELIKHLRQWLSNLNRAGQARKLQSIDALRAVILASRSTAVYMRHLRQAGLSDYKEEASLSRNWTELSFRLLDLKLSKLAKRCDINGRYWSDPKQFDAKFIEQADVGLEQMEKLAKQLLAEITR